MKILIVEDDKNSIKLMLHFLGRFGTCEVAQDGLEAVAAVMEATNKQEGYDLLVMDIMMPNMDGIQTLEHIRNREERLKIPKEKQLKTIMVSALTDDSVRAEVYLKGCIAFIRKPVDFKLLESVIRDEFKIEI